MVIRILLTGLAVALATALVATQGQQPPAPAQTPQPAQGRGGFDEQAAGADFLKRPPVTRLDPAVEQKLFLLPDGFSIEPVLSDPLIQDPVGVTFDGNGRMYVLEMRSYMQDADGSNSRAPISRISRHEDTDGDGVYDKHTVFVDNMVMPRIAFPLQDGVILALETDSRDLYKYTDTDGDGVADKKELFYPGFGRVTNMEWQPGGLTWALDNWLYTTYNPFRLRIMPDGKVAREETDRNGGQWWSAQDNYGKMWWVDGGGEIGPVNFQEPIAYGAFNVPDNFEPDFQIPWSAPGGISDMQGGMRRVRMPEGTLNHFTAASGVEIYRGDRLPSDFVGDLFFNEPVGRIVRRAKIAVTDGLTQLRNAYPKSEFVRSTDPLFRPVAIHNAPDGTLYLVDMYTGIIQDAEWVNPGSYLRRKVEQYDLDKIHNFGRIWRITYSGAPDRSLPPEGGSHDERPPNLERPHMYSETPAQLVQHLTHPNGWWRDTAQKLLVLAQDKSVVPALKTMARSSENQLARIHALWTIEGLGSLDAALARELMKSPDPQIRIQAIRASETLYKANDTSFAADYRALLKDPDPNVVIQAMLTINLQRIPDAESLIRAAFEGSAIRGVREIGSQILHPTAAQGQGPASRDTGAGPVNMTTEQRRSLQRGEGIYTELCFTCHGADGKGAPMGGAPAGSTLAPPLAGSPRVVAHRDYVINVLLNGLTGPIGDASYPGGIMVPMGTNSDEWIADIASYVRNSFGNRAMFVKPEEVAAVRKADTRTSPWTVAELEASVPKLLTNTSAWKLTASHNSETAANVVTTGAGRWDTGAPQAPGMWFQIELPEPVVVTDVQLEASLPSVVPTTGAGLAGAPAAGGAAPPAAGRGGAAGRGRGFSFAPARGPVAYSVQVSDDGASWGAPVAQGAGSTTTTAIALPPTRTRFLRITQTGTAAKNEVWAIQQLRIYGRTGS